MKTIWKQKESVVTEDELSILQYTDERFTPVEMEILTRRAYLQIPTMSDALVGIEDATMNYEALWAPGLEVLREAIDRNQTILVWGDFDADGVTATAALIYALKSLGVSTRIGIANRLNGGHGINVDTIKMKLEPGGLVVTVDNGVTDKEAVDKLLKEGYNVLVTDHHLAEGDLPQVTVVNPKVSLSEDNPEYMAPGVYVAAKLGVLLCKDTPEYIRVVNFCRCMTAIGILSDVIPLTPYMRKELMWGLAELNCTQHAGLRALFAQCSMKPNQPLTSMMLIFNIIPKINAAGRLGDPYAAVNLLLMEEDRSASQQNAVLAAMKLKHINEERKLIEQTIYETCTAKLAGMVPLPSAIILYQADWHPGVLGVIASRLCEEYFRPILICSKVQDQIVGSGRAPDGFDLYSTLQECSDLLLGCGGHRVAAGFQLKESNFEAFKQKFESLVDAKIGSIDRIFEYDAKVRIADLLSAQLLIFLENIEPTGKDNPDVAFYLENICIKTISEKRGARTWGVTDPHEEFMVLSKYRPPKSFEEFLIGDHVDAIIVPHITYFTGNTIVEWRVTDLRYHQNV